MAGMLSPDSRVYQCICWALTLFFTNVAALCGLGLVLPGGISWLVLFSVGILLVHEEPVTWRVLLRIVRRSWLGATLLWWADVVFLGVVSWEFFVLTRVSNAGVKILWGGVLFLGLFVVMIVNQWWWLILGESGVLAAFAGEKNGNLFTKPSGFPRGIDGVKLAILLAFRYLPRSLVGVVLMLIPVVMVFFWPDCLWKVFAWACLFGLAFGVYLVVLVQHRPLARWLGESVSV